MLAEALVELASETPTADARSLIQHPGQERGRLGSRDREAGGRHSPSSNVVFPEFAEDSSPEGDGFELLVPRHESPRFSEASRHDCGADSLNRSHRSDQRKQPETAGTKPKMPCLAAMTSERRRGYIAAIELDLCDQGR